MAEKQEKTGPAMFGMDAFKKATDAQLNRLGLMLDEASTMQARWFEVSNQSIAETGDLTKSSIKYFNDLSTQWRRMSLDGTRKALEFIAP